MDSTSPSPLPPPPASAPGGTHTGACAACKFQRRRCKPDCLLAAAFPADQALRFDNAHRLFGVANLEHTVEGLDPRLRAKALETLIFESEVRARDPIGGCCRLIRRYEAELERCNAEIPLLQSHLAVPHEQTVAELAAPPVPAVNDPFDDLETEAMSQILLELEAELAAPPVPAVHDPYDDLEMEAMRQILAYFQAEMADDSDRYNSIIS